MNSVMNTMNWFVDSFSANDFKISTAEFEAFLADSMITFGKLQDKTVGQIFCERYQITDGLLCAFVNDDYCIDRIRTFYVRR